MNCNKLRHTYVHNILTYLSIAVLWDHKEVAAMWQELVAKACFEGINSKWTFLGDGAEPCRD